MEWVQIATAIATVAIVGFVATYWLLARWWRTQEGQNVILLSGLLIVLAGIGFARRAGLPPLAADILVGLAWSGVAVAYVWRTGLLLRAQGILHRRRPPEPPTD